MSKGENIFKRRDGRWEARYIKGRIQQERSSTAFVTAKPIERQKKKLQKQKRTF